MNVKNFILIIVFSAFSLKTSVLAIVQCGCHVMRPCYQQMLDELLDRDEAACVEDAEISPTSIEIYLKALKKYCSDIFDFHNLGKTYEFRNLVEVVVSKEKPRFLGADDDKKEYEKPVIIIDAGQRAGKESIEFAMYIIQQLTACMENDKMVQAVKWVILPCTNPDGFESTRYVYSSWYKNRRLLDDKISVGVDISRNFDYQFNTCSPHPKPFAIDYPGECAASEIETKSIKNVLKKYKSSAKAYVSLRRDGHSILYPYGYTRDKPTEDSQLQQVAATISSQVNQKAGSIQLFANKSIYEMNGKRHCGNSVDFAYDYGIPLAFEMRVFFGDDKHILTMFQPMPRGLGNSLRSGYFNGIKGLYNIVKEKKASKTRLRTINRPFRRSNEIFK